MKIDPVAVGRCAYEAYSAKVGGRSVHGDTLPTWDEMSENSPAIAEAWQEAGVAVARMLLVGRGV